MLYSGVSPVSGKRFGSIPLIYVFGESAQNAKRDAMLASREGFANPATWKRFGFPGNTLIAFVLVSPYKFSLRLPRQPPVQFSCVRGTLRSVAIT
jgi:hypothetical protein